MAKGKYEYWRSTDGLILLQGWTRDGLTDAQIAHNCGIRVSTLYEWKNRFPEIMDALKKGKEIVDYEVENALLKRAKQGDVTAEIFWLKNRRPVRWREKVQVSDDGALAKLDKLLEAIDKKAEAGAQ